MNRVCGYRSCSNTSLRNPEKRFFELPSDRRWKTWLINARRRDLLPDIEKGSGSTDPLTSLPASLLRNKFYICGDHFEAEFWNGPPTHPESGLMGRAVPASSSNEDSIVRVPILDREKQGDYEARLQATLTYIKEQKERYKKKRRRSDNGGGSAIGGSIEGLGSGPLGFSSSSSSFHSSLVSENTSKSDLRVSERMKQKVMETEVLAKLEPEERRDLEENIRSLSSTRRALGRVLYYSWHVRLDSFDVQFVCSDGSSNAHRLALAIASPNLNNLLLTNHLDTMWIQVIHVPDISVFDLDEALEDLYLNLEYKTLLRLLDAPSWTSKSKRRKSEASLKMMSTPYKRPKIENLLDQEYIQDKLRDLKENEITKCNYCDLTFKTYNTMCSHRRSAHPEAYTFVCQICGREKDKEEDMLTHLWSCDPDFPPNVGPFDKVVVSCIYPSCETLLFSSSEIRSHIENQHSSSSDSCPFCGDGLSKGKSSTGVISLTRHIETLHYPTFEYICPLCSKEFDKRGVLHDHWKEIHLGLWCKCLLCHKNFKTTDGYNKHMRLKHYDLSSEDCVSSEERPNEMNNENEDYDKDEGEGGGVDSRDLSSSSSNGKGSSNDGFSCKFCLNNFSSKYSLLIHYCKIFVCNLCGAEFISENEMVSHKRDCDSSLKHIPFPSELCPPEYDVTSCALCQAQITSNKFVIRKHLEDFHNKEIRAIKICPICLEVNSDVDKYKHIIDEHHVIEKKNIVYICPLDGESFAKRPSLLNHYHDQHLGANFRCIMCGDRLATRQSFKKHKKIRHGNDSDIPPNITENIQNISCKHCPKTFPVEDAMNQHVRDEHSTETFICTKCSFEVPSRKQMLQHKLTCEPDFPQDLFAHYTRLCQFPDCGVSRRTTNSMLQHIKSSHGAKLQNTNTCPICGEEILFEALLDHVNKAHQSLPWDCLLCPKTFTQSRYLYAHWHSAHLGAHYRCGFCSFTTNNRTPLNLHMGLKHTLKGVFSGMCDECGKGFDNPVSLKLHRTQIHCSRAKKISCMCEICCQTFQNSQSYRNHMKHQHPEDGIFRCLYCNLEFEDKKARNNHQTREHMSSIKYSQRMLRVDCEVCGASVVKKDLKMHMTVAHPSTGPIKCLFCDRNYKQYVYMTDHIRKFHKFNMKLAEVRHRLRQRGDPFDE